MVAEEVIGGRWLVTGDKEQRKPEKSMMAIADEKMGEGNENHGAQGGRGEGVPETAAKNSEFHEHPATNEGTNDSKNDVRDAAEASAARDFSCQPAGDQADQQPSPESMRDCNPDTSDLAQGNQ